MFQIRRHSVLRKVFVVIAAVLALTLSYILFTVWSTMPMIRGQILVKGLNSQVEIIRDEKGIPTIQGEQEPDVYFAQGYVHAQDRLFQMVLMKHMFSGRMSEIFGSRTINLDRYMRYFNLRSSAEHSYPHLTPESKMMLDSYAKGVNQFIAENRMSLEERLLGYKVEPWSPIDCMIMQKAIAFDLSKHWPKIMRNTALAAAKGNEALDLFHQVDVIVEPSVLDEDLVKNKLPIRSTEKVYPDGPSVPQGVVDSYEAFAKLNDGVLKGISTDDTLAPGSNVWGIDGGRTVSGQVMMASDPHLAYNVPNTFYLIHLKTKRQSFSGGSIPGAPGMIIGRNNSLSWGFTNSRLAQSDIYYAKDISGKVERTEVIKVAKGADVSVKYIDTDYGTIISEPGAQYEVAFRWTGMEKIDRTFDAIFKINVSESVAAAKPYLKYFHTPAQNLVMADNQGQYGFYALGKIPMREHSGRIAVPAEPEYRWKSFIPSWEMPYVENPKRGYVMNTNNYVVSNRYGHNLTRLGFDDLRAVRLTKMLKEEKRFGIDDMKAIQLDSEDQEWLLMREVLLQTKPKSVLSQKALAALRKWDGHATQSHYEATIYSAWQRELSAQLYSQIQQELPFWAKPVHNDFFVRRQLQSNGVYCQGSGGCDALMADTLEAAVNTLKNKFHSDRLEDWKWGEAHYASFKHSFFKKIPVLGAYAQRRAHVNGTRDSLNRSRWYSNKDGFAGVEGACLRMISDLDEPYGEFSIPMGQSSNIFSKHYADILDSWAQGEYIAIPNREESSKLILMSDD